MTGRGAILRCYQGGVDMTSVLTPPSSVTRNSGNPPEIPPEIRRDIPPPSAIRKPEGPPPPPGGGSLRGRTVSEVAVGLEPVGRRRVDHVVRAVSWDGGNTHPTPTTEPDLRGTYRVGKKGTGWGGGFTRRIKMR